MQALQPSMGSWTSDFMTYVSTSSGPIFSAPTSSTPSGAGAPPASAAPSDTASRERSDA